MKDFKDFLNESEDKDMIPEPVIDAWKKMIDYDFKMKQKFSYFDVAFKSKGFTPGHKGHMTKSRTNFENKVKENSLDPNLTIKKLMNIYPPKYI